MGVDAPTPTTSGGITAAQLKHFAEATYFQLLGYAGVSNERDVDLAQRLTRECKLATIPVSVFYADDPGHRVLRICFAKDDVTLGAAAAILCSL